MAEASVWLGSTAMVSVISRHVFSLGCLYSTYHVSPLTGMLYCHFSNTFSVSLMSCVSVISTFNLVSTVASFHRS